jgi:hypothetical protein
MKQAFAVAIAALSLERAVASPILEARQVSVKKISSPTKKSF